MRRIMRMLQAMAGWLLLYLIIGAAIGLLIRTGDQSGPYCGPFNAGDGVIVSACQAPWANTAWTVALGVPRLAVLLPALFCAMAGHGITQGNLRMASNGLPFLVLSLPLALIAWAGTRFWWRRRRAVGRTVLALLLAEIAVLATMA